MRLIDADKLMESLNPKESVWVGLVLSELIANAPTVKAIPIEWIKEWLKIEINRVYDAWTYVKVPFSIPRMIEDWEKENEIN